MKNQKKLLGRKLEVNDMGDLHRHRNDNIESFDSYFKDVIYDNNTRKLVTTEGKKLTDKFWVVVTQRMYDENDWDVLDKIPLVQKYVKRLKIQEAPDEEEDEDSEFEETVVELAKQGCEENGYVKITHIITAMGLKLHNLRSYEKVISLILKKHRFVNTRKQIDNKRFCVWVLNP